MRLWGRGFRALTAAITSACLAVQLIQVAPAVATPKPSPPVPVELEDERTEFSKTWDNGDGTRTFESYIEPVHYRDQASGSLEEIDTSLVETVTPHGRGFSNRANAFRIELPESEGDAPIGISCDEAAIYLTPKGRILEPPVHGASAEASVTAVAGDARSRKYLNAYTSADLLYTSVERGLKETIVLNRYSGRNVFSYNMECIGLAPSLEASGSIAFTRTTTGAVLFRMQAPFMEDSASNGLGEPARSDDVRYELKRTGNIWRLDVVADKEWLASPLRVYPVRIDPTTYFEGTAGCYDAHVYSSTPTSNYGTSTSLNAGRASTAYGINRAYVRPELSGLAGGNWSILKATLRLYCYDRLVTGSTKMNVGFAQSSWDEYGLTWNNQPTASYVTCDWAYEGDWTEWDVTRIVQDYVLGLSPNNGFSVYADSESGATDTYCKFYARENTSANDPVIKVLYTSTPKATIVAPSLEVPVSSDTTAPVHVHWRFDDALDKTQTKVHIQLGTAPGTVAWDSGQILCTDRVRALGTPTGGWQNGRYWVRMRVWGKTDEAGADTLSAPSLWTAWQPFDRGPFPDPESGHEGYSRIGASDPVGAGLSVDLASGHLWGTRTDFAGNGLGGPLSYGAFYDSSVVDDFGLGRGWSMASPSLDWDDHVLAADEENAGFEQKDAANNPLSWGYSNDLVTACANSWPRRNALNNYYLMIGQNPANGFFSAYVYDNPGGKQGKPVAPGERVSAAAWVLTYNLTPDTSQAEYGALMKLHFYDGNGNLVSSAVSAGYRPTNTATSGDWRQVGLEVVAPANAVYMRLNLEARNIKGYTYWDDVTLHTYGFSYTDGDGTKRSFRQVGSGIYNRDPLEPGVRFTRVNALAGAQGVTSAGAPMWEATDGVINGCAAAGNYDAVTENAGGTNYITYELQHAEVLSEIDLGLYEDQAESSPRLQTFNLQVSETGSTGSYATVASGQGRNSWVKCTFDPCRVRFVRVVALDSTVGTDFRLAEIEAPVLKLADSTVYFDGNGILTRTADPSGNPTSYAYDAQGRISSVSDGQGRTLTLNWTGTQLTSLDWLGKDSSGSGSGEGGQGIVSFEPNGLEYRIRRKTESGPTTVLTYTYDTVGRISGATDADGVGFDVEYESAAPEAKVHSVTRYPSTDAETVTTYVYGPIQENGSGSVTISTRATLDGAEAPTRIVTYCSDVMGNQPESVTTLDQDTDLPYSVAWVEYDEYGQLWKSHDPFGRMTRTERDGRGNVLITAEHATPGAEPYRQSLADYSNDHVVRAFDVKDNESSYRYDTAWRLLNALTVTGGSPSAGSSTTRQSYDEWGNLTAGGTATSTSYNLIRNGTFELDPLYPGNGWEPSAPFKAGGVQRAISGQAYLGKYSLVLGDDWVASHIFSDEIAIKAGETYALSAWTDDWGQVEVFEYGANHAQLSSSPVRVLHSASGTSVPGLNRISGTFVASPTAAYARVKLTTHADGCFVVDNVRLERANSASPDSLAENESMERISVGLPQAWHRDNASAAVHDRSSAAAAAGVFSAHIAHSSSSTGGFFRSDSIPVTPGEYTVSASIKTVGSKGGAQVFVYYHDAQGAYLGGQQVTSGPVRGTRDWTRYTTLCTSLPATTASVLIYLLHNAGGGDAYFDAVSFTPGQGTTATAYDSSTHTYAVSSSGQTDITVKAAYDDRGRTTETRLVPRGGGEIVASDPVYNDLDQLSSVAIVPGTQSASSASYDYSDAGRLQTVEDPLGHVSTITYDAAKRVVGGVSAEDVRTKTEHDGLGRPIGAFVPKPGADPDTPATAISYDGLSRVEKTTYFDPTDGGVFATLTPTYDVMSRVKSSVLAGDVSGRIVTDYDDFGRPDDVSITDGPAGTYNIDPEYDVADLPLNVTYDAFGQDWQVGNTYLKTNELATRAALGQTWHFSMAQGGGLTTYWSDEALRTRSFDVTGRLAVARAGVKLPTNAYFSDLFESLLFYDDRDRIQWVAHTGDVSNAYSDGYTYDDANRLTRWEHTGEGGSFTTDYAWDAACNLDYKLTSGVMTDFTYDDDNRLDSAVVNPGAPTSTTTYINDVYGRRTSAVAVTDGGTATTTYTWNPLGNLVEVSGSSAASTYKCTYEYGITGMREKTTVVVDGGAPVTRKSVWDGQTLVAEEDSDGKIYRYVWGPDRTPLGLFVTQGATTTRYSYHTDAQGSVAAITRDDNGTVVARYRYDAFGGVSVIDAPGTDLTLAKRNPLRYRSYYYDEPTSLYYLPARYYEPEAARFLSPDPVAAAAGDPLSLNAYTYCQGDPVNCGDSTGMVTDVEAEAWGYYNAKFKGNRQAAWAATRQTCRSARGRLRTGGSPKTIILYGGMAPGDGTPDCWEQAAWSLAGASNGDTLVFSGQSQSDWEWALTHYGSIDRLIYIGHSTHEGRTLWLSAGPVRDNLLTIEDLPTENVLGFGSIELVSCETASPGGVVYQMNDHFGCHVIGNKNIMAVDVDGDYWARWKGVIAIPSGWGQVDWDDTF